MTDHPLTFRDGEPVDFAALARLEEGRLSAGVREVAAVAVPMMGGWACRDEPGNWLNYAAGCGLAGPVSRDEVRALRRLYEEAGIEPRLEICPFIDPTLTRALADEGFVVRNFETVYYRGLDAERSGAAGDGANDPANGGWRALGPPGLEILVLDPSDEAALDDFARTALSGFLPEGVTEFPQAFMDSSKRVARQAATVCIRAMLDGACVGAGAMEVRGPVACLFGVSVRPAFRKRGVQRAMLAWRLREAARRGAVVATIGSRPGVATERNAQRAGFRVAYTKLVLVRPGEGLTPVVE